MSLEEYAAKRRFEKTPEPPPSARKSKTAAKPYFCVQRHDATRLHYDFRLEIDGVLKSWAVPKGSVARPRGEASSPRTWKIIPWNMAISKAIFRPATTAAGSVMLWDRGTFELLGDMPGEAQMARGDLKFRLHGEKLKGDFALVHMKGAQGQGQRVAADQEARRVRGAGLGRGGPRLQRALRPHPGRDRAESAGAQDQAQDRRRGRSRLGEQSAREARARRPSPASHKPPTAAPR